MNLFISSGRIKINRRIAMRFFIMILPLLIVGFSLNSFANTQANAKANGAIINMNKSADKLEADLQSSDQKLQKGLNKYGTGSQTFIPSNASYRKDLEGFIRERKRAEEKAREELKKLEEENKKQQRSHLAEIVRLDNEDLQEFIESVKVQSKFALFSTRLYEFNKDIWKMDDKLDALERVYDKSVMGAYLQDKIGQLLNSNAICMARNRCAKLDPEKIDPETIRKELFPESSKGYQRSDYHDKAIKNRGRP